TTTGPAGAVTSPDALPVQARPRGRMCARSHCGRWLPAHHGVRAAAHGTAGRTAHQTVAHALQRWSEVRADERGGAGRPRDRCAPRPPLGVVPGERVREPRARGDRLSLETADADAVLERRGDTLAHRR